MRVVREVGCLSLRRVTAVVRAPSAGVARRRMSTTTLKRRHVKFLAAHHDHPAQHRADAEADPCRRRHRTRGIFERRASGDAVDILRYGGWRRPDRTLATRGRPPMTPNGTSTSRSEGIAANGFAPRSEPQARHGRDAPHPSATRRRSADRGDTGSPDSASPFSRTGNSAIGTASRPPLSCSGERIATTPPPPTVLPGARARGASEAVAASTYSDARGGGGARFERINPEGLTNLPSKKMRERTSLRRGGRRPSGRAGPSVSPAAIGADAQPSERRRASPR